MHFSATSRRKVWGQNEQRTMVIFFCAALSYQQCVYQSYQDVILSSYWRCANVWKCQHVSLMLLPVKTRFPRRLRCNEEVEEGLVAEACKEMSKMLISAEDCVSPPDLRMFLRWLWGCCSSLCSFSSFPFRCPQGATPWQSWCRLINTKMLDSDLINWIAQIGYRNPTISRQLI